MLRSCKSQFGEKNTVLPNEKFPSLTTKECDNVTTRYHSSLIYYLSIGLLREVKKKRKFQTFSSKSGRGRLRELITHKRFQLQ